MRAAIAVKWLTIATEINPLRASVGSVRNSQDHRLGDPTEGQAGQCFTVLQPVS